MSFQVLKNVFLYMLYLMSKHRQSPSNKKLKIQKVKFKYKETFDDFAESCLKTFDDFAKNHLKTFDDFAENHQKTFDEFAVIFQN